eukprot:7142046-Alexandrium_andersonii.AAC.1
MCIGHRANGKPYLEHRDPGERVVQFAWKGCLAPLGCQSRARDVYPQSRSQASNARSQTRTAGRGELWPSM